MQRVRESLLDSGDHQYVVRCAAIRAASFTLSQGKFDKDSIKVALQESLKTAADSLPEMLEFARIHEISLDAESVANTARRIAESNDRLAWRNASFDIAVYVRHRGKDFEDQLTTDLNDENFIRDIKDAIHRQVAIGLQATINRSSDVSPSSIVPLE
ncbi:MAG: hypothetical protein KDA90_20940 [Planctomycetaceae bacterium]|nr:hypothetical protein [Planctomycetaceae bacterium]